MASPRISPQKLENDLYERRYLPDCWLDDKRMEVLFSPFRLRYINPEGWDLKMNFWVNQINKWCLNQSKVVFTIEDAQKAFVRADRQPFAECLKLVVSNMKRNGKLLFPEDLQEDRRNMKQLSRNFASWTLNTMLVKPFTMGWNMITSSAESNVTLEDKFIANITNETRLINREALEVFTESVETYLNNKHEKGDCMRYGKFISLLNKGIFAERNIDEQAYEIICTVLESKNKIKVYQEDGIKIVKVGSDVQVKDNDIILIKLEFVKERLEAEAAKLDEDMEEIKVQARKALEAKNRDKALSLLKRKKRLENKLKDKDAQIENIEVTYEQLLDTGSQQMLVSAFQIANDILKKNTKQLEEVEDTMAQVEDTLAEIASITSDINRPLADTTVYEQDAELELNEMLDDIKASEEKEKKKLLEEKSKSIRDDSFLRQIEDLSIIDSEISFEERVPLEA